VVYVTKCWGHFDKVGLFWAVLGLYWGCFDKVAAFTTKCWSSLGAKGPLVYLCLDLAVMEVFRTFILLEQLIQLLGVGGGSLV
jgi:hypothetical protein